MKQYLHTDVLLVGRHSHSHLGRDCSALGSPASFKEGGNAEGAGTHVRNAATLGGHFALCRSHALESDVATLLLGLGGSICLAAKTGSRCAFPPI